MRPLLTLILISSLVGLLSGCAICLSDQDCKYPAYGGSRDRIDRYHGRVSSLFDPAQSLESGRIPPDPLPPLPDESPTMADEDERDDDDSDTGLSEEIEEAIRRAQENLPELPDGDDET